MAIALRLSRGLERITLGALRHPGRFLLAALAVSVAAAWFTSKLEVRSSFEELLPPDVPSVVNVKELVRRVGGDGTVLVVVEAEQGPEGLPAAEKLALTLADEILALGPSVIRSVEANEQRVEAWYEDHWPLFASVAELRDALDRIAHAQVKAQARTNPLAIDLDADEAAHEPAAQPGAQADSAWLDEKTPLPRERIAQRFARYKDGFLVHPDGRSLTLVVRPAGTSLGVAEARRLLDRLTALVDTHTAELRAAHLRVGFAGTFPLFVAEYEAILHDVASTALLVSTLVLASLFLFYRDLRSTAALGASVFVAVIVTFGLTKIAIGYLNTQTAFLGSIVVGNGINYGLIYLARVSQLRRAGVALERACVEGAHAAAQATLLASAASSVSFGMLILAANRGFRHFGFIGGLGMLLCWASTFLLVPAWLSLFERIRPVRFGSARAPAGDPGVIQLRRTLQIDDSAAPKSAPAWLERLFARPRLIVATFAALALVSAALFLHHLPDRIERNLTNLTNDLRGQAQLVRDNQRGNDALGKSVAGAVALLPSLPAADAFCAVIRERQRDPNIARVVEGCDTLSSVVPSGQAEKLELIHQLAARLRGAWVDRLSPAQAARLREVRAQLEAQRPVSVAEAPPTLLDRFRERDGTLGRIAVVTARGDAMLELAGNLEAFAAAVRRVPVQGRLYDAGGENVVFADLLQNIDREGPRTTFGSLFGVCVLVLLSFRHLRLSAEVIGALITGVLLMAGAATLAGIKINFFNFIVFPITFGIAVDYGANVISRARDRGRDVLRALAEVGPAVALCSWTSMIGYGSLLLAINRALRSFGRYAIIGEITSIASALVFLPALSLLGGRRAAQRTVGGQGIEVAASGSLASPVPGKGESPGSS